MSHYREYNYEGIIKPGFCDDIEKIIAARDWNAAGGRIEELCSNNFIDYIAFPQSGSGLEMSFSKEDRRLVYECEFTRAIFEDMGRFARILLPAITEKIISFKAWDEYHYDENEHPIEEDLTRQFETDMRNNAEYPRDLPRCIHGGWGYYFGYV